MPENESIRLFSAGLVTLIQGQGHSWRYKMVEVNGVCTHSRYVRIIVQIVRNATVKTLPCRSAVQSDRRSDTTYYIDPSVPYTDR